MVIAQFVKVPKSAGPPSYMASVHVPFGIAGPNKGGHVLTVGRKAVGPGGPNPPAAARLASARKVPV